MNSGLGVVRSGMVGSAMVGSVVGNMLGIGHSHNDCGDGSNQFKHGGQPSYNINTKINKKCY